jgi:hypothetical protein
VLKHIANLRSILEDGVFIIQDKPSCNADIVGENVQDLYEITDLKWLGVEDDSEGHITNLACNNIKMKKSYIESVVHEVYSAEIEKVKPKMLREEALKLLHLQLKHLPYQLR